MKARKVPFFVPAIGEAEIAEVTDSLRNGWLTTGIKATRFEAAFAEFLGAELHCIAVNSATAGLHLALEALGVGPGDEVIVPDYTFTASAEVVRYLGADPVLVDVDYHSLNITVDGIRKALTARTKVIMPVHFAGLGCDMEAICALAANHGIAVVEDAAHAIPTTSSGRLIGTFPSAVTVFSFYANKTITTGEGGMLVTADAGIAARARKMRLHGMDRDAFDRFSTGKWKYDVIAPGFKYNMTDIAASLGIHQLARAREFQAARARVCARYSAGLKNLPLDLPANAQQGDEHAWHLYVLRLRDEAPISRDELFDGLMQAGITCSVHYTPLHQMTYWRDTYRLSDERFPQSHRSGARAITLPLYPGMSDDDVDYVVGSIKRLLAG